MNKKIATEIAVGIILIISVVFGLLILAGNRNDSQKQSPVSKIKNTNLIASDYGFDYSIPYGWHIWEGNSAAMELFNKTDFAQVLKTGETALTNQKVKEYQAFMDSWKAESSETVIFTNAEAIDYKSRSFSDAGKIMSRIADSEDMLKQREITMNISSFEVNLSDVPVSEESKESRNIKIDGKDASLLISKKMKLVDWIIIKMPINSNEIISGKKVSSLVFMEYVRKNSLSSVDELISFITSLRISNNQ